MSDFWAYGHIHVPNFILAAIGYTILGRLALGLFVPADWDNYIWRFFRLITDPIVRLVRLITPSALGGPVLLIFAYVWVMTIRFVFLATMVNAGLAPNMAGA